MPYRREQFIQFVESLDAGQTPSWLGLPNNAEKVLLTNLGEYISGPQNSTDRYGLNVLSRIGVYI